VRLFDAHTHAWPPRLYAAIVRWFDEHAWSIHDRLDGDAAAAALRSHGVSRWVAMAYCHKPGMARDLNRWLAGYAARNPEAVVLAAAHPHDDDPAGILAEAFDELGLRGLKLHCHVMGIAPDDASLGPIYDVLQRRALPLVIHAGRAPELPGYPSPAAQVSGLGYVARVLARWPELRCVVPHLGFDELELLAELLERHPRLMTDTAMILSGYIPGGPEAAFVARWADRILYGTDFPILPYAYDRELRAIRALGLGDAAERAIFHDNAARVFLHATD
jgi:predicted TIM-barrel fold metal-dependent hydrolase